MLNLVTEIFYMPSGNVIHQNRGRIIYELTAKQTKTLKFSSACLVIFEIGDVIRELLMESLLNNNTTLLTSDLISWIHCTEFISNNDGLFSGLYFSVSR